MLQEGGIVRDAQLCWSCAFENEHFGLFVGVVVLFPGDLDQVCGVVRVCNSDWRAYEFVIADLLLYTHVAIPFRSVGLWCRSWFSWRL